MAERVSWEITEVQSEGDRQNVNSTHFKHREKEKDGSESVEHLRFYLRVYIQMVGNMQADVIFGLVAVYWRKAETAGLDRAEYEERGIRGKVTKYNKVL